MILLVYLAEWCKMTKAVLTNSFVQWLRIHPKHRCIYASFYSDELSKRELDYRPVLLLPFGAKPSALVLYQKALL